MNDEPRHKLREIIDRYGQSVVNDPRRCRALLLDYCGQFRREIFVLYTAQEEQVANDLQEMSNGIPLPVLVAQLTRRLMDNRALAESAARWAVESWAYALRMTDTPSTLSSAIPPSPSPQPAVTPPPLPPEARVPASRPIPAQPQRNAFVSRRTIEVYGRPRQPADAPWQKLGATPGAVDLPPDHVLGLRTFDFDETAWASWVSEIANSADVGSLTINNAMSNDGLASLRAFTNLTYLEIKNAEKLTDEGMASLTSLHFLATLSLAWGTRLTDAGLQHLKNLSRLATLELRECKHLIGTGLLNLEKLTKITALDLTGAAELSDTGIQCVGALKRLTKLTLSHCSAITPRSLVHLSNLSKLTYLDLAWNRQIDDNGIAVLGNLSRLATLNLSRTSITDVGLAHVGDMPTLMFLDLSWCSRITDKGLEHLRRLDKLAVLNVSGCPGLTPRGLARSARPGLYIMR